MHFSPNHRLNPIISNIRAAENLPDAIEFWMAYVARDALRLGVFFRALAIMLQVPGGARFEYVLSEDEDDDENSIRVQIEDEKPEVLVPILAECLNRLKAPPGLLKQAIGGQRYRKRSLSAKWKAFIDRQSEVEHGLVNIVAECLEVLIVQPGLEEIDDWPDPTWWQACWRLAGRSEPQSV